MAGGETVRDLVVRLRLEQIGTADVKLPEWRKAAEGQKEYNKATREGSSSVRDQLKPLLDSISNLKARNEALKDNIEKEKRLAEATKLSTAAQQHLTLAYRRQYDLGVVETVNRLARAYSFLAAAQGDSAEKMARSVLVFQGAFDAGRGLFETLARLRNVYHGLTAAVAAYNATAAVSGAASFAGLSGGLGRFAAGATGLGAAGLGIATNPITLALSAGAFGIPALRGARRDFETGDRGFTSGIIDGIRSSMGGITRDTELTKGIDMLRASIDKLEGRLGEQQKEFSLQRSISVLGGAGSITDLRTQLQDRLSSSERRFGAIDGASLEANIARSRIAKEIFQLQKQTQDLLKDEQRLKQASAREAIRSEEQRLKLLDRELQQAERIADLAQKQINRGVTSFAELSLAEQKKSIAAAGSLRQGGGISERERDLLERVGGSDIQKILLGRDTEAARRGGYFGAFAQNEQRQLSEANKLVSDKQRLIDASESSLESLRTEAETIGAEIAKQTKEMAVSLLEGFRKQLDAEKSAVGALENAQKAGAGG